MSEIRKVYIEMLIKIDLEGNIAPVKLIWENGSEFDVDKVLEVRMAPPEFVGAYLTRRYLCMIGGKPRKIYQETQTNKWFVETAL